MQGTPNEGLFLCVSKKKKLKSGQVSPFVESGGMSRQEPSTHSSSPRLLLFNQPISHPESSGRPISFSVLYSYLQIYFCIYSLFARKTEVSCSPSYSPQTLGSWFLGVLISTFAERGCNFSDGPSGHAAACIPEEVLEPKKMMLQSMQVIICLGISKTL